MNKLANALPARTQMENYWIQRPLKVSKTAIVYLAEDMHLNRKVFLIEFFLHPVTQREYRADGSFFLEASGHQEEFDQKMACFRAEAERFIPVEHPNIIKVTRSFEANATAYAVAEYAEGDYLGDYLQMHGGRIGETELKALMFPLFKALRALGHHKIEYGNVNVANIYRYQNGAGALMCGINCLWGNQHSGQGERDSIYALGALMYEAVTGTRAPDLIRREYAVSKGEPDPFVSLKPAEGITKPFSEALNASLDLDPSKRPKSVMELQMLMGDEPVRAKEAADVGTRAQERPVKAIHRLTTLFYYAFLSIVAGTLLYLFLYRSSELQPGELNDFDIARYHLAANLGNNDAQRALGDIYLHAKEAGHEKEAFFWYHEAAADGDASAQLALGRMYEEGIGIPQNRETAAQWYGKAASQGLEEAQELLMAIMGEENATR